MFIFSFPVVLFIPPPLTLTRRLGTIAPRLHLLDFGCLWDTLQVFLEHQDFGIFLLQNGDQVVQESDVSTNAQRHTDALSWSERVKCAIYCFYYVGSDLSSHMEFYQNHIPSSRCDIYTPYILLCSCLQSFNVTTVKGVLTCRYWIWCLRSCWVRTPWSRKRFLSDPCSCSFQRPAPPPTAASGFYCVKSP